MIYKTVQEVAEVIVLAMLQRLGERLPEPSPSSPVEERPLSIKEACELLGVTEPTLRDWRKKGLVRYRKIGDRYYFLRSELIGGMEEPRAQRGGKR